MTWPPTLEDLKLDMRGSIGLDASLGLDADTEDDERLQQVLNAAAVFVERVRPGFNYVGADPSNLPDPTPDLILGTLRLAGRWHIRRRSPDALVNLGNQMGSARVPSFDPDIERLLGIGRYAGPVFA